MPRFPNVHHRLVFQYLLIVLIFCWLIQPVFAQQTDSTAPTDTPAPVASSTPVKTDTVATDAVKTEGAKAPVTNTPYYSSNASDNKVGSGSHLLSVTFALLFIVLLIVAVSWFIRRFGSGVFAGNPHMKILAAMPLGTRERVILVEVGGQQLLLGVTASQINTLHVFSEPVDLGTPTAPVSDFSRKLMTLLQKNNPSDATTNNNSQGQG